MAENGINYPVDQRIDVLDEEDDISEYYLVLCKPAVNPASILFPNFCSLVNAGVFGAMVGEIREYSLPGAPDFWLQCNGQAIARTSIYGALLVSAGCPFGDGNGSTTVNIPNREGRVAVGVGDIPGGGPTLALGDSGGTSSVVLSEGEMPSHAHSQWYPGANDESGSTVVGGGYMRNDIPPASGKYTGSIGENLAHENMQPYTTHYFIVFVGENL